jgi:hypothetical protein
LILAALAALQGIFQLGYGFLVLFTATTVIVPYGNIVIVKQVFPEGILLSGIMALILAYGLWTLQKWAFWVMVILETVNLVGGLVALFTTYNPGAILLSLLLPAIILTSFFADPHVREAFSLH